MPIIVPSDIQSFSQTEFQELDYRVMRHIFASHNDLGRFCDETIYQHDVAARLVEAGFGAARTEVEIKVGHQSFTKSYFLDLVVLPSLTYEFKTAAALSGEHQKQLLNYLLLLGVHHGKLVNFRPASVETFFVSTQLTPAQRYAFRIDDHRWKNVDDDSAAFRRLLLDLFDDWGVFLDLNLYGEAIVHFRGGEGAVIHRLELERGGQPLGTQRAHLLNAKTAFKLTAFTADFTGAEKHLRRFLGLTTLTTLQWINFNREVIEFITLTR